MESICRSCRSRLPPREVQLAHVDEPLARGDLDERDASSNPSSRWVHFQFAAFWYRSAAARAFAALLGLHISCAEDLVGQLAGIRLAALGR